MSEQIQAEQKNSCGVCRACCTFLTIPAGEEPEENRKIKTWISSGEEEKQAGVSCPQLNPNKMKFGCTIHNNSDKPSVCSSYLCSYALGLLGNNIQHRPDNLGLLIDIYTGKIRITEIDKGALSRQASKRIIYGLANQATTTKDTPDWDLEVIPNNLIGTKMGIKTPIVSEHKLSIGKK